MIRFRWEKTEVQIETLDLIFTQFLNKFFFYVLPYDVDFYDLMFGLAIHIIFFSPNLFNNMTSGSFATNLLKLRNS